MTDLEAIERRVSRRAYRPEPLEPEQVQALELLARQCSRDAELNIRLVQDDPAAFRSLRRSYGMFSGVRHYFAMAGSSADLCLNEKVGYYGEKLVLEATKLGLGTCWVGGTFDRKRCAVQPAAGEELVCLIVTGKPATGEAAGKERLVYRLAHRSTKPVEQMYEAASQPPEWFLEGMWAVQKAPSALNRQPVRFTWANGEATAQVPDYATHQSIDLGIAKLHFELAAERGQWGVGNGAAFRR